MRFERIEIPAYGPFTGAVLDLASGKGCLEIVYGPNEAGKSSLLRAISDFLFGIPSQTGDGFLHSYGALRIRATVANGSGRLDSIRRKANVKSLREADDDTPVPDEKFRRFVPLDNREVFEKAFGLSAQRLREGGEELLEGHGEFGEMLFSAASGIEGLHNILKGLDDEADKLFKPRGGRISEILKQLDESKKRLRNAQVLVTEWERRQEEVDAARAECERLEEEATRLQRERARLERIRGSRSLLRKRREILEKLSGIAAAKILRGDFEAEYGKADRALFESKRKLEDSAARVENLRREVEAIVLPAALLAREREIDALFRRAGEIDKNEEDRTRLHAEMRQAELEMALCLRQLGEPPEIERAAGLIVRAADKRLVEQLVPRKAALDAERWRSEADLENYRREWDALQKKLDDLAAPKPVVSLKPILQQTAAIALEEQIAQLRETASAERGKIEADMLALPWTLGAAMLESAALPSGELVSDWMARLDRAEQFEAQAELKLQEARDETARIEREVHLLRVGHGTPSESELTNRRLHRDLGWRAVRYVWLGSEPDRPAADEFLPAGADDATLAAKYEASVTQADETADRMRDQASQVAKLEQLGASLELAGKKVAERREELDKAAAKHRADQAEWRQLWEPFATPAGAPRQMAEWLRRKDALLVRFRETAQKEASAGELAALIESAKRRIEECLVEIGETGKPSSTTFSAWRSRAEMFVDAQEDLERQRAKLTDQISAAEKNAAAAETQITRSATQLAEWSAKWAGLMSGMGLTPATEPEAVQAIIRVREELQENVRKAEELKRRIDGMERDAGEFSAELRLILEEAAPEFAGFPDLAAADKLSLKLREARDRRNLRETKAKDLEKEAKALERDQRERKHAEDRIAALTAEAKCESEQLLPSVIEQSNDRKKTEADLRETDGHLLEIGAGRSVEQLEQEASAVDPDQIPFEIGEMEHGLAQNRQLLDSSNERRFLMEQELRKMENASDACDAAADMEDGKAQLLDASEDYVRVQLARLVLKNAVDEYRQKSQNQMLERSSAIFTTLTGGSFSGLRLDWNNSGRTSLMGVRGADGALTPAEAMSEGTRDQLYLALRIACLELYAKEHEPVPFIADDILINFDDARARAALRALAELARHTQVILFTHHRHLVELARAAVAQDEIAVSEIDCGLGSMRRTAGGGLLT